MYAIVECLGVQYRVTPDEVVQIPKTDAEPGSSITFDRVLFLNNGGDVKIGSPVVDNAKVEAEVLGHGRAKKIIVGKYKRRKGYRRRNGHRQYFTEIKIKSIEG